ncbi:MAG: nitrogenase cofactor biosynthesis protein NifB [Treponema sp.]|jgi:nitrogenase cofactor biosynthesis protein NifB|nr:nitrogenase cofactor biosynthesis protein NifB [Treponema sp.]
MTDTVRAENLKKSLSHPCFNGCGGKNTRIHLPVAPACNIQCNYCVRKYECANESRPGVTARVCTPKEALDWFLSAREKLGSIDVAGIAGPGDALANFEKTRETFALIREADPDISFCLSTNGLLLPRYADELAALGVSHVTVTVNAPDPKIGKRIYRFVEWEGKRYLGEEGAALLLTNQYAGIRRLRELGIICKINMVLLKDLNDSYLPAMVEKVKEAGADLVNIMQLIPVKGSLFEHLPLTSNAELTAVRRQCEGILPQMYHCRQCRADAVGRIDEDISLTLDGLNAPHGVSVKKPGTSPETGAPGTEETLSAGQPARRFAVASKNGMVVDQHFGHAEAFHVYEYQGGQVRFIEKREIPRYCFGSSECGEQEDRFAAIVNTIKDCSCVIAVRIGEAPRRELEKQGIKFFMTYDYVTDAVRRAAGAPAVLVRSGTL